MAEAAARKRARGGGGAARRAERSAVSVETAKAARQILRAVERNRRRALIGPDAFVFDAVSRLPAGLYQRFLVAMTRRERAKRAAGGSADL